MSKFQMWGYIIGAVAIALLANSLSAVWAGKEDKFTPWLLAVIVVSPFVFISFGFITSKLGLAITSATVDSLLTITTIIVGLFLFREWGNVSLYQYAGMALALTGIILMHVSK